MIIPPFSYCTDNAAMIGRLRWAVRACPTRATSTWTPRLSATGAVAAHSLERSFLSYLTHECSVSRFDKS